MAVRLRGAMSEPFAPPSDLQVLVESMHYRLLLCLDEGALSALSQSCVFFADTGQEPALWKRLVLVRDRNAAMRFMGGLSPEAREEVSVDDPRPAGPSAVARAEGSFWRDVGRQLNTRMSERPWEHSGTAGSDGEDVWSAALWTELTPGWNPRDFPTAVEHSCMEAMLPAEGLFAGQAPHLFWVGGNRLLAVSGIYFGDNLGGAEDRSLNEAYAIELLDDVSYESGVTSAAAMTPPPGSRLRCTRLDTGPGWHPSMNGSAGDFDPRRRAAFFFGGGSPHSTVHNVTSALCLRGWDDEARSDRVSQLDFSAHWERFVAPEPSEAGMAPLARQGVRGVVFGDEFIIFGGRSLGGGCLDDVWSLDLAEATFQPQLQEGHADVGWERRPTQRTLAWRQLVCEGRGPSPRVWYAACHAVYGRWFIYGGSTWAFESSLESDDLQAVYILDLAARSWSSVDTQPGPRDSPVASTLVALGNCQMLLLGGTFPCRIGNEGLTRSNLENWREWYSRLDMPQVFDLGTQTWSGRSAAVAVPPLQQPGSENAGAVEDLGHEVYISELLLRSHLATAFVPSRRSVIVFGGSRYFTGEYFHDVLELELPGTNSPRCAAVIGSGRPPASRLQVYGEMQDRGIPKHFAQQVSRGLISRYRALDKDNLVPAGLLQELVQQRRAD